MISAHSATGPTRHHDHRDRSARRDRPAGVTAVAAAAVWLAALLSGCSSAGPTTPRPGTSVAATGGAAVPRPDHVVVVVEENHSYADIIGNTAAAPYLNSLAGQGASFTHSFAVTHPSEPNYLALFSGSTQGVTDDSCPHSFAGPDLGSELTGAGLSFAGYSEDLPATGSTSCDSGAYARKHNPWLNFTDVPGTANQPWTAFPHDYTRLPTLSFVVPNLDHDMHDGSVQQGDSWLRQNLGGYATWAKTHNSLLVVTWDEDDQSQANQIPTLFIGEQVRPGQYAETVDHYRLLRTLEDAFQLPHAGYAASVTPVVDAFRPTPP
ncbi:alkaline phosphatase family protein [Streptacidiphilus sp. EB129]|uniref:alkaline phosphatase family protein n=1 Tax=Streptacidiphilus sp. EB129 TaxID=3156262 RepID=UPI0035156781